MLKKTERLSRGEFNRFFLLGSRSHSKNIQLIFTPYATKHISVVVSKKVVKNAVDRNRLRRRVYNIAKSNNKTGVFIFIMKKNSGTLPYQALKKELQTLIETIKK